MYRLHAYGVVRLADGQLIRPGFEPTEWAAYQAWVAAGNTALPAEAQIVVMARAIDYEIAGQARDARQRAKRLARASDTDLINLIREGKL